MAYSIGFLFDIPRPQGKRHAGMPVPGSCYNSVISGPGTKDDVWYAESGAKPNTIVRFDPRVGGARTSDPDAIVPVRKRSVRAPGL